ncbi:MAG TPA: DUF6152 family protein [Terriglobia bacterium]|nr:DUF6152 family protein [Terriglobia bacterium]
MKSRFLPVLLLAAIALPTAAVAHHSFTAEYESTPMTLVGVITRIDQANPHGFFYLEVQPAKAGGRVTTWALETPGPNQLIRTGFTEIYQDLITNKEKVTVKAYPAKDGAKRAFAETVTRADNRTVITISTGGVSGAVGRAPQTGAITIDGVAQPTPGGDGGPGGGRGGRGPGGGGAGGRGGAPRGGAPGGGN